MNKLSSFLCVLALTGCNEQTPPPETTPTPQQTAYRQCVESVQADYRGTTITATSVQQVLDLRRLDEERCNLIVACLDRHLPTPLPAPALAFEFESCLGSFAE